MFSRVLGILKDARERLKQSDERVRALTADVTEYTKSEKLAHEKVGHLEKSLESLKAKRDAQATRLAELEREFEEEVCLRKAVETKLRRVVKGSMALLEIPVDAALLGQITNFGTVVEALVGVSRGVHRHTRIMRDGRLPVETLEKIFELGLREREKACILIISIH
ncbi:hypothetical protein BCR33DRAFT_552266 [Rhizoclosmatium globosum]|uniref:SMC hinge domain-containing protein n=1 Tax=Rhizoclosmatium globosum TaxID=329046 RepID=A0A1Y2CRW3_9FUNG|nr:hypothetical protein BCR33DRAFT_552266 [Rhizoclosmatium globosum]|eukprot:ORY49790.1 hypothetical protein BCR33DRAFT_552266 [Rhizoclosmatium globosum]